MAPMAMHTNTPAMWSWHLAFFQRKRMFLLSVDIFTACQSKAPFGLNGLLFLPLVEGRQVSEWRKSRGKRLRNCLASKRVQKPLVLPLFFFWAAFEKGWKLFHRWHQKMDEMEIPLPPKWIRKWKQRSNWSPLQELRMFQGVFASCTQAPCLPCTFHNVRFIPSQKAEPLPEDLGPSLKEMACQCLVLRWHTRADCSPARCQREFV